MKISKMAIIGVGTMGHGIAKVCAVAGLKVNIYSATKEGLEKGYSNIKRILDEEVANGMMNQQKADEAYANITVAYTLEEAIKDVDMVLEAILEDLEIKQNLFKKLDALCDSRVILTTNTSGLSPTMIGEKLVHKERMVATHFWCPPELIPLVEIIPSNYTSPEVMDVITEWVETIGKKPVKMKKECLGFIGNRMQYALLREALYIYENGWADMDEIDKAVEYSFGRRYPVTGPFRTVDLGGVDVFYNASSYLFKDLSKKDSPGEAFKQIFEEGKYGLKTGEGFYKWDKEKAEKIQNARRNLLYYFLESDKENQ